MGLDGATRIECRQLDADTMHGGAQHDSYTSPIIRSAPSAHSPGARSRRPWWITSSRTAVTTSLSGAREIGSRSARRATRGRQAAASDPPAPRRPLLRYLGGKWRLAQWILSHCAVPHSVYVEPYGGAGSVLLRKPRVRREVINDLDDSVVALYRVLRDPRQTRKLAAALAHTPHARAELLLAESTAHEPGELSDVERARRLVVRSHMGMGALTLGRAHTGFAFCNDPLRLPRYVASIAAYTERLRGVIVEQDDALSVIRRYDSRDTLTYCDPPYVLGTRRSSARFYSHDWTERTDQDLVRALRRTRGYVLISGYRSELTDSLYGDWERRERSVIAQGYTSGAQRRRTECLWLNPRLSDALACGSKGGGGAKSLEALATGTGRVASRARAQV